MKQTIYVDVLICVNLFVNYFLLLATSRFLKIKLKRRRILIASLLGAFYSLYILVPRIPTVLSFLIKIAMSITMILCAFGFSSLKTITKETFCFYSMNFVFCGIMFAFWYFISPQNIAIKNGITYINISPILLVVTTLFAYITNLIIQRLTGRDLPENLFCDVLIEQNGNIEKVTAKIDTGNDLKEPFSQLPVLVVEKKYIEKVIPSKSEKSKFRVIPFHTVSGEGLLSAFKPDKAIVFNKKNHFEKELYVAICEQGILPKEFSALANIEIAQI